MPIVWTQDPAANELLETDPLALLIGMVLDQQVKMEKAFAGPYELKRRRASRRAGDRAHGSRAAGQGLSRAPGAAPFPRQHGESRAGDVRDVSEGLRRRRRVGVARRARRRRPRGED